MNDDPKVGPVETYPRGKPTFKGDKGGLCARLGLASRTPRLLYMQFGTVLNTLSSTPEEAIEHAAGMRHAVEHFFGAGIEYSDHDFPLKIRADKESGHVITSFPSSMSDLMANPEVFLVW